MTEDELTNITLKLSTELYKNLYQFFRDRKDISMEDSFVINTTVISALIFQTMNDLFKKDTEISQKIKYVDALCESTKRALAPRIQTKTKPEEK